MQDPSNWDSHKLNDWMIIRCKFGKDHAVTITKRKHKCGTERTVCRSGHLAVQLVVRTITRNFRRCSVLGGMCFGPVASVTASILFALCRHMHAKTIITKPSPVTVNFDLSISKLVYQLPVLSAKFYCSTTKKYPVHGRQGADGQTDGGQRSMQLPMMRVAKVRVSSFEY